jgi:hypothetical protein
MVLSAKLRGKNQTKFRAQDKKIISMYQLQSTEL